MRDLLIVTLSASMRTVPLISILSMTVPGVLILRGPEGVSVVPGGTPVVLASGNEVSGPDNSTGGSGGVCADASTRESMSWQARNRNRPKNLEFMAPLPARQHLEVE